jgi:hypothetical protein
VERSEGFGERLLGMLLDRAHEMPPQLIAPMIAEEVATIDGRDVSVFLQDDAQELLVPCRDAGCWSVTRRRSGRVHVRKRRTEGPVRYGESWIA